ncbi:hypothetical protein Dimus_032908 [Dionaea muscipula]
MRAASSHTWRSKLERHLLVSQISSILLQRHNWASILPTLDLSSQLNIPLFLQILRKIQINPQISLNFFNWVKTILRFQPDLKAHCRIILLLIQSKTTRPVKPIMESLIKADPPNVIVDSMLRTCKGTNLQPLAFSSLIECYAHKGFYLDGLEVFRSLVTHRYVPTAGCCIALLDVLERVGEFKLAWCLCGSMTRNGFAMDLMTWSVIARILYRSGKSEKVVRLLDSGICNSVIFNLVIDYYCKCGKFEVAVARLNEMCARGLEPGFNTHSLILDRACEFGNLEVIEMVMHTMMEKKLIPQPALAADYDRVIKRLCNLGRTYAAGMLYGRAKEDGVGLEDATFGCMLRAFSKGGRVKEAISLYYDIVLKRGIVLNIGSYQAFVEILCRENDPTEEVNKIVIDLIKRGVHVHPCMSELSKLITLQCRKAQWRDAEDLLTVMIERGFLPDSSCCRSLVNHYFSSGGNVDSAMSLHHKLVKSRVVLDVATYNQLLRGLFSSKRVEEAVNIFDYMRRNNLVSRASFLVMISGLYGVKDMRKAMQVHDEMLKLGLKPNARTYKSLIRVFSGTK